MTMDLPYQTVDLQCPRCGYIIEVLLKQVMTEETVLCSGCYAEIHLRDEGGSAQRAQTKFSDALADLKRQLGQLRR